MRVTFTSYTWRIVCYFHGHTGNTRFCQLWWSFKENSCCYLLCWWIYHRALCALLLHQYSWYIVLTDMMHLHTLTENGVVITDQNYNFLCSLYCLTVIKLHRVLHLSLIILVPCCCRSWVIFHQFKIILEPVILLKQSTSLFEIFSVIVCRECACIDIDEQTPACFPQCQCICFCPRTLWSYHMLLFIELSIFLCQWIMLIIILTQVQTFPTSISRCFIIMYITDKSLYFIWLYNMLSNLFFRCCIECLVTSSTRRLEEEHWTEHKYCIHLFLLLHLQSVSSCYSSV